MPIPAPGSLPAEKAALAPGGEIDAAGKDLGGTRLPRRGRSLGGPPGETFPGADLRFSRTVLQLRYARGPAPGNFFWGRSDF